MSAANDLTKAIITYIRLRGGHANRVNNIARQIEGRFIKSTTEKGIPDILACIRGAYVGIEVKIGRDSQSPEQREQAASITKAGGQYLIARTFDQIQTQIDKLITQAAKAIVVILTAATLQGCAESFFCNCSNPKPKTVKTTKVKTTKVKTGDLQLAEPKQP